MEGGADLRVVDVVDAVVQDEEVQGVSLNEGNQQEKCL